MQRLGEINYIFLYSILYHANPLSQYFIHTSTNVYIYKCDICTFKGATLFYTVINLFITVNVSIDRKILNICLYR